MSGGNTTDDEWQAPKRLALQDSNLPRYEKEFVELSLTGTWSMETIFFKSNFVIALTFPLPFICLIVPGVGEFGVVHQCLNRLDGCIYAIKKSIKPVAGSITEYVSISNHIIII